MFKKSIISVLIMLIVLSFAACGQTKSEINDGKVSVCVTFNALKEFTEAVGGDKVRISTIIPDGTEPHDFEPKAQDLIVLSTAKVFVYNGLGMEAWKDEAISAAANENLIAVDASKGIDYIDNAGSKEQNQYDPHIWLSLKCAEIEAANIKDALVKADPVNKDYYENNCKDFITKLESLYSEYNEKFSALEKKNFVTGHAAYAYLCRDFGLNQKSVEDVFAEGEPSAQQLTDLVEFCKSNSVTTIFSEQMVSPEISQTLAAEVKAKVETIYTIESSEDNMSYLERMQSNLSKIFDSLSQQ